MSVDASARGRALKAANRPPTKNLSEYGDLSTGAGVNAAITAFIASNDLVARVPAAIQSGGTYSTVGSWELVDGQHKTLLLDDDAYVELTGGTSPWEFWCQPKWISNVTAITRQVAGVNLSDDSDVDLNTVTTLTLADAQTIAKYDILKLVGLDILYDGKHGGTPKQRVGEDVIAGLSSTGTTLTLAHVLADTADTYTVDGSTGVRIGARPNCSMTIRGGRSRCSTTVFNQTAEDGSSTQGNPIFRLVGFMGGGLLDHTCERNIGAVVMLRGCFWPEVDIKLSNLKNQPALNRFGYGVDNQACTGARIRVSGTGARHPVTDNAVAQTIDPANPPVGKSFWSCGRTRGTVKVGLVGFGNSNDTVGDHDEGRGTIEVGIFSANNHKGSGSGGGGAQHRGADKLMMGLMMHGGQRGHAALTSKGALFVGANINAAQQESLYINSGSSTVAQNAESDFTAYLLSPEDNTGPMVASYSGSGVSAFNLLHSHHHQPRFSTSATIPYLYYFDAASTGRQYWTEIFLDLRYVAAGSTITSIFRLNDGWNVKAKVRIYNPNNVTITSLYSQDNSTSTCTGDFDWDYEGLNDLGNASAERPFGTGGYTALVNVRTKGVKNVNGTLGSTASRTIVPVATQVLNFSQYGDEHTTVRLAPTGAITGSSSNAVQIPAADLKPGQRVTLVNTSAFLCQIADASNVVTRTLAPNSSVTIAGNLTGTGINVVSERVTRAPLAKTTSYSAQSTDHVGQIDLNAAAGGQTLTLSATAGVGRKHWLRQIGAGAWTIAAAGSGTIQGLTATSTQYAIICAECQSNSGGSAAVWAVSAGG